MHIIIPFAKMIPIMLYSYYYYYEYSYYYP